MLKTNSRRRESHRAFLKLDTIEQSMGKGKIHHRTKLNPMKSLPNTQLYTTFELFSLKFSTCITLCNIKCNIKYQACEETTYKYKGLAERPYLFGDNLDRLILG
ncbi:hypothetical protein AALO_G00198800 [Alosa alosa]|uniref:Uncharacterized protein n=1 Tax=Alosa alosa TaxID=278164 RepID=A0AAV6G1Z0_9TELE|nr:hypothetical protein AALO_G00198800 [Alosa alosa]